MNFNYTKLNKLKNKKILLDILNIDRKNSKILNGNQDILIMNTNF